MDFLLIIQNRYIYIPLLTWFVIQLFKLLHDAVKNKKVNFKRIIGAGGMPSSHAAVVMAISTMIGKNYGFDSSAFAVCFVFSCVVMYDAMGIRRESGKHAKILNKITELQKNEEAQESEKLIEALGHTPCQVGVGALIGIIVGAVFG